MIDFETYSEAGYVIRDGKAKSLVSGSPGIVAVGAAAYAEHPSAEILCLAYDIGQGVRLWVPGMPDPKELFEYDEPIEAHNAEFEYYIWRYIATARLGWPALHPDRLRCSAQKSRAFSLPGSLEGGAIAIGLADKKDPAGKALLRRLSIPKSHSKAEPYTRRTPVTHPLDFFKLYEYCKQDVRAEAALSAACPALSPEEEQLALLDRRINTKGVAIDMDSLNACIDVYNYTQEKYEAECKALTGCLTTETAKLKDWLATQGVLTDSLDKEHVAKLLDTPMPPAAYRAVQLRQLLAGSNSKKLFTLARRVNSDGRLRSNFVYCGASRTGRFAGSGVQLQNLKSSGPDVCYCNGYVWRSSSWSCPKCGNLATAVQEWGPEAVEACLKDCRERTPDEAEAIWGNPIETLGSCLRGLFVAAPGYDLICSDYSAIEAVVLAALAGEEWRLEVFRTHGKIYEMSAAKISGVPFEEIIGHKDKTGEHHPLRKKVGKVAELASGYMGWIGAWKNFGADKFMDDNEIKQNILKWRAESPMIEEFWGGQFRKHPNKWEFSREFYGLEGAAIQAVLHPGTRFDYREIEYIMIGNVLYCRLPSGRFLNYHQPILKPVIDRRCKEQAYQLTYMGHNSDPKHGAVGWTRLDTYGGKLTENVVQAVARDLLRDAMLRLDAAGYPIVLHVHDEITAEVPEGWGSVEEFEHIMSNSDADWCAGWPVRASGGWRGKRFRK